MIFERNVVNMNDFLKNVNRIEFVVTMACTGRCKHCSEGEHIACKEHIDGDVAAQAVIDICAQYKIESLMTFGGEPLLYPEDVCRIQKAAMEAGIPKRELITNGFFSKDKNRIAEVAHMLAESGVNKVLLSVDAFHQETIPLEPVEYFADCVRAKGIAIELSPAWLVSKEDNNPYNVKTRELLSKFVEKGFAIANGNVIWFGGNAKIHLREYFDETKEVVNPYEDDPRDVRAVSFNPNGDVLNGNIYQNDIMEIFENYHVKE